MGDITREWSLDRLVIAAVQLGVPEKDAVIEWYGKKLEIGEQEEDLLPQLLYRHVKILQREDLLRRSYAAAEHRAMRKNHLISWFKRNLAEGKSAEVLLPELSLRSRLTLWWAGLLKSA